MGRVRDILHVDIDAFFASVEQVRDPRLRGRPVIVGGLPHERSIVISASYEARHFGVGVGMVLSEAHRRCPRAVFLKGEYASYRRAADTVWETARRFTPLVEVTSLDDAYLDLTGTGRLLGRALDVAERLREDVLEATGLSLSLGLAGNRTVARVATDLAKPAGLLEVLRDSEAAFLAPLPIRKLPGVGRRTATTFERFNVKTIGEIARLSRRLLTSTFGEATGRFLHERSNGRDDRPVRSHRGPRGITRETTFEQDTADRRVVRGMVGYLVERAARELREDRLRAKTVAVKIRYSDWQEVRQARSLREPIDDDAALRTIALDLFRRLDARRVRVRLVGVSLSGFSGAFERQRDLFAESGRQRRARLSEAVDSVRDRYGFGAVVAGPAIELVGKLGRGRDGFVLRTRSLSR
jgi:DNA polymerase IV